MSRISLAVLSLFATQTLPAQRPGALDAPVVAVEAFSRIDELVDLDLDGDLDGAGIWFSRTTSSSNPIYLELSMHRNDGAGRLTKSLLHRVQITSGGQPTDYRSVVGDFDGDGNDDLFTLLDRTLCLSRPGDPVVYHPSYSTAQYVDHRSALFAADVDSNGTDEIVIGDNGSLRVFQVTTTSFGFFGGVNGTVYATAMTVADATGDAVPEALVFEGPTLGIYTLSTGNMSRIGAIPLHASWFQVYNPAVTSGDVDGDGDVDIVLFGAALYMFVERVGPTQFQAHAAVAGGPATHLFDFDGDGDLDGCCCGGGGGPTLPNPNWTLGQFEYAENFDGQTFAPAFRMTSVGPFHLAGCADMDGDGHDDLVGGRCIYFGPGSRDPLGGVTNPQTAPVTDLDDDGDPDVFDPGLAAWQNRGDGSFAAASLDLPPVPAGATSWSQPLHADHDGDGDVDLFAYAVGAPNPAMHLLDNQGGGHFVDRGEITQPGQLFQDDEPLRLVDLDGDRDLDVVAIEAQSTHLWLRQPGGTFAAGGPLPGTVVIGAADFDGDSRTDLLAGTAIGPYWWDLTVLQNLGNASFAPRPGLGMWIASEMGIVDHDGDGDLDVIGWTYNGTPWLTVFLNDGTGVFTEGPHLGQTSVLEGGHFTVTDVDGDGLWDVVAGPSSYPDFRRQDATGCWVVRQTSPGQFDPVLYTAKHGPLADVDGDGDLDVVGPVLARNLTFAGDHPGAREQYGSAVAGAGGAMPCLGATGPFRTGATMQAHLRGGIGAGLAVLSAAWQPAVLPNQPLPGLTKYLDNSFVLTLLLLTGVPGAPGQGSADFPIPLPPSAAGLEFYLQAFPIEPGAGPLTVRQTQGLRLKIGW